MNVIELYEAVAHSLDYSNSMRTVPTTQGVMVIDTRKGGSAWLLTAHEFKGVPPMQTVDATVPATHDEVAAAPTSTNPEEF
jgi:hypothetical protein